MKRTAEQIIKKLKRQGITVQEYHTKNNIYLKLDYGVLNTVKIGNNEKDKHLEYRYVIHNEIFINRYDTFKKQFEFSMLDVDLLIDQILKDHYNKKNRYGFNYSKYMDNNKKHLNSTLWANAILAS